MPGNTGNAEEMAQENAMLRRHNRKLERQVGVKWQNDSQTASSTNSKNSSSKKPKPSTAPIPPPTLPTTQPQPTDPTDPNPLTRGPSTSLTLWLQPRNSTQRGSAGGGSRGGSRGPNPTQPNSDTNPAPATSVPDTARQYIYMLPTASDSTEAGRRLPLLRDELEQLNTELTKNKKDLGKVNLSLILSHADEQLVDKYTNQGRVIQKHITRTTACIASHNVIAGIGKDKSSRVCRPRGCCLTAAFIALTLVGVVGGDHQFNDGVVLQTVLQSVNVKPTQVNNITPQRKSENGNGTTWYDVVRRGDDLGSHGFDESMLREAVKLFEQKYIQKTDKTLTYLYSKQYTTIHTIEVEKVEKEMEESGEVTMLPCYHVTIDTTSKQPPFNRTKYTGTVPLNYTEDDEDEDQEKQLRNILAALLEK